jgi:polysaccharide export outer membrane protein
MSSSPRVHPARFALLLVAVVAAALAGCNRSAIPGLTTPDYALATPAPLPPPGPLPLTAPVNGVPGVPANPYGSYRLDSGDRVRVIVFGQDNLSRVYSVDTSGSVSLPLAGPMRARGLTTVELANDIAAELRRKYIKDPKVSVEVDTYRPFFILGEVKRPGGYPYVNGMTVEAGVALAEGYTERAKQRMVRLTRRFNGVNSTVMVPTDYPVQPGDTIYVLERFF